MAAQSHADIRKIVGILSLHRHSDLRTVCSAVHVVFPDHNDEAIRTSIDLAMRLWLTLNTREKSLSLTAGKTPIIRWEHDSSTMVNFVRRQFPSASAFITGAEALLDPYFSAYNLTRNCQVTIEWTCSLADHLSLDLKTRRLRIYPLKICLYDHGNASGTSLSATALTGPIISRSLIQETIWSLELLFPSDDKDTDDFLVRSGKTFHNDPPFDDLRRPLDLNEYHHWRGRLSNLRMIYNAEPRSLRHALTDRRSTLQLYTLWTAVIIFCLTVFFGVISAVTAIIQTRTALRSLDVAIESLRLQQ
ncbi:hypothetical protein MMC12_007259 [Toensbergia leucococca]|nr:hypothetical protein [Toensbergia leucococca]